MWSIGTLLTIFSLNKTKLRTWCIYIKTSINFLSLTYDSGIGAKKGFSTESLLSLTGCLDNNDSVENTQKINLNVDNRVHNLINNIISKAAGSLYNSDDNKVFIANNETQTFIESLILNEFNLHDNKNIRLLGEIDPKLLGNTVSNYILDRNDTLIKYICNLENSLNDSDKTSEMFMKLVVQVTGVEFITSLCLYNFLVILSQQDTRDFDDNSYFSEELSQESSLVSIAVKIGKSLVHRYLSETLKSEYIIDNKDLNSKKKNKRKILKPQYREDRPKYSVWIASWKEKNPIFNNLLEEDDKFYSILGSKLIDILENSYFVKKKLIRVSKTKQHYDLVLFDEKLKSSTVKQKMYAIPTKLPMIVKPKNHGPGLLGGYLLNDVDFKEDLFISKKAYSVCSQLSNTNNIYDMVNNISKTPFKVNIALLNYITFNDKYNLLIDTNIPHEFEALEKISKYQESKYRSHNSKLALQETVLEIVNFYKQFNEIYFPVRLDQRGRIYCTPSYFNYQSNELSKSLILFSIPGIIKRTDLSAISYLKAYGANCYGGTVSKASIPVKEEWVNKNIENIIDYDNGILLSKAKDKLLFLAFCMELKRFYTFFINQALMEFETYLPIQLDATCNGFQHMALLSNEKTLNN